jgi:hypothetical protein
VPDCLVGWTPANLAQRVSQLRPAKIAIEKSIVALPVKLMTVSSCGRADKHLSIRFADLHRSPATQIPVLTLSLDIASPQSAVIPNGANIAIQIRKREPQAR